MAVNYGNTIKVKPINKRTPAQALNPAYFRQKLGRAQIDLFKLELNSLIHQIGADNREENVKYPTRDFLNNVWYKGKHHINTKDNKDFVIHHENNEKSNVAVLIEAKAPKNKTEMVSHKNLNTKALQELLLYYLTERIGENNKSIKHLIVTNVNEWYVFDEVQFDNLFAQNKKLVEAYNAFEREKRSTDWFYKEIAKEHIAEVAKQLIYTHFDLRNYEKALRDTDKKNDKKLIALYKLLSPEHLLKLPFANDSNQLDRKFYSELLHIIGLGEEKEKGKKIITRCAPDKRNEASLLEAAIIQIDALDKLSRLENVKQYGDNRDVQLFNIGLELGITWINRVLFLKLLEGQLLTYNKGNEQYKFLDSKHIKNYDDLNTLFFQVLAKTTTERRQSILERFAHIPYLNSSLFEPTELEQDCINISNLADGRAMPVIGATVLKDEKGKARKGNVVTIEYLFEFLNAYDFTSEGAEDIQEENKTLINASVLGLIFEKINGYKDGSFFTPGFITMYMCRETLRRSVVQKFNDAIPLLGGADASSNPKAPLLGGAGGGSNLERASGGSKLEEASTRSKPRRKIIPYNPALKQLARDLRNNSTKSEIKLWKGLKGKFEDKYDFHRQKPLDNYIADFFCHELSLAIEVDGITHTWEETQQKDLAKEIRLNELGVNVLRFTDDEVHEHLESTLNTIRDYIRGFEKGDLSAFVYEDTPLNPLSRGDFHTTPQLVGAKPNTPDKSTPKTTMIEGHKAATPLLGGAGGGSNLGGAGGGSNLGGTRGGSNLGKTAGGSNSEGGDRYKTIQDIYNDIGYNATFSYTEANKIVNSLKICDPAVGSGHFLVSALNELISIKHDLGILQDANGKKLRDIEIAVVNDELIVRDEGQLFEYKPNNKESQRVQETLFKEKQTIIENCLFGVDINPNSVKICRLRLWIELLKNAYYKPKEDMVNLSSGPIAIRELETLPNIDINIKCGNSLVSRFALDADLKKALKSIKWNINHYKSFVLDYKHATNKEEKRGLLKLIDQIKGDFRSEINKNDPKMRRLQRLNAELWTKYESGDLFETKLSAAEKRDKKKLETDLNKLTQEIEEIKSNKIYENAFEWRFEFPEVLNDKGDFVGFDAVIGNPPYFQIQYSEYGKEDYFKKFNLYERTGDIYSLFFEQSTNLLKSSGTFSLITSNRFGNTNYGESSRKYLSDFHLNALINFNKIDIFDEANVGTIIVSLTKKQPDFKSKIKAFQINDLVVAHKLGSSMNTSVGHVNRKYFGPHQWVFDEEKILDLKFKILNKSIPLSEINDLKINRGITTGANKVFIIPKELGDKLIIANPRNSEIIKPVLKGAEIKRFEIKDYSNYLLLLKTGIEIKEYPEVYDYLTKHKNILEKVYETKMGSKKWYELRNCSYYASFQKEKLIWTRLSSINSFAISTENEFSIDSTSFATGKNLKYYCALLNSKVTFFYFKLGSVIWGADGIKWFGQYFDSIPIVIGDERNKSALSDLYEKVAVMKKYHPDKSTNNLENEIDQLVYQLYGLTAEEIKIVEESVT